MSSGVSIRGYRDGFLFVVALLAAVTGVTFYSEVRTNTRVDALVEKGLERGSLIAGIRVAALQLEEAVSEHINAQSDDDRNEADVNMQYILEDIKSSSTRYAKDLPPGEAALWKRFYETSQALVNQVRTAVRYSNRKQAERARRHLEEEVKPVVWTLEETAGELTRLNMEETQKLLRQLEDLRLRNAVVVGSVAALAIVLALLVGRRVVLVLQQQERTIGMQLEELGRRNLELDAFASRVAHDLMGPLSPLKGYLTLIRRTHALSGDAQAVEMLQRAEASADRMAELIEALLRFCRAGKAGDGAQSELDTAVTTLLLEVSQTAAAQGVALERQLEPDVTVACAPQLLQSIAQNVLSNAVKYSAGRPDAQVRVRVARDRGAGVLDVEDNGAGMGPEALAQLFHPFFRAQHTRGLPGHGLGMATTKRLVEAHGGTISVWSALEQGTRVTVRLPLATPKPAAPPLDPLAEAHTG